LTVLPQALQTEVLIIVQRPAGFRCRHFWLFSKTASGIVTILPADLAEK